MTLLLLAAALAGPRPADPVDARLGWSLRRVATGAQTVDDFRHRTGRPLDPDGLSVSVVPARGVDDDALAEALAKAGFAVEARAPGVVQVHVPWGRLRDVAAVDGVGRVREPWRATAKERVTEGWAATMDQDWHDLGVTGKGAMVGIIDVGFEGLDTLGDGEAPEDVLTDWSRGDVSLTSHGTAVTEIIADFAPDASYYLATFSYEAEFCEVLQEMVEAGVDVINGSIGFDNTWHADGTSPVTRCADQAVEDGALYFAAAGNENDKYRVGTLEYVGNEGLIALAGQTEIHGWSSRGYVAVSLRWSEPFGEAAEDLDLFVYDDDLTTLCGSSEDFQDGEGNPYEIVVAEGCTDEVVVMLYSESRRADLTGLEGYLYDYDGLVEDFWTNTEDLTLPGDLDAGLSIGAYYPDDDTIPYYSSRGPTNDGRTKPDLVAPTGVTTRTYGTLAFEGSSAATPHATGLGALWVSATRWHDAPGNLRAWMIDNARDVDAEGLDENSGWGAIHADEVPDGGCRCATGGRGATGLALGLAALALLRRRA